MRSLLECGMLSQKCGVEREGVFHGGVVFAYGSKPCSGPLNQGEVQMESCVGEWTTYRLTISPGGAGLAGTIPVSAGLILSSGSFGLATEFPCMISSLIPIAFQEDFTGPAQMWLAFRYLEKRFFVLHSR